MSRMQLGPNGEKQRVIVERDFNNDDELNAFLAEFEENISKVTAKEQNSKTGFYDHNDLNETYKSPGYISLFVVVGLLLLILKLWMLKRDGSRRAWRRATLVSPGYG
jgi:hypothetical protein